MCIIVYKPENVEMPSAEILATCFEINNDGAGYMFVKDDKVHINKGFSTFEDFYKSLMRDYRNYKSPYVIHFRIKTHGANDQTNTHPFVVSKNMADLLELKTDCDMGLAHNGMFSLPSQEISTSYSDTMYFVRDYFSHLAKSYQYYKNNDLIRVLNNLIKNNRVAVLSRDKHVELLGDFEEYDGCYYSNGSYKSALYTKSYYDEELINEDKYYHDHVFAPTVSSTILGKYWEKSWDDKNCCYDFKNSCPCQSSLDKRYCALCKHRHKCALIKHKY